MNARQFALVLLAAALALPLLKKLWEASHLGVDSALPKGERSQVVEYVEKTLHDHEGEDSPLVHAFEAALEEKTRHGDPART